jgi:hypothetical protein
MDKLIGSVFKLTSVLAFTLLSTGAIIETPQTSINLIQKATPVVVRPPKPRNLPSYLVTVLEAGSLDDAGVGYAAEETETFKAFTQTLAAATSLYPKLRDIYPSATPAGKIYLARVIYAVHPDEGRQLLRQLTTDSSPVTSYSGCIIMETTVSQIAKEELEFLANQTSTR